MISENSLNILKSFCKLNNNFNIDNEEILVATSDASILGRYMVDIKDGLEIFNKYPLNNINQLIDDIEDMSTYDIHITNSNNLIINGVTKKGIQVKIKRLPAIIDENIELKIKKIIDVFNNSFDENIEFTIDKFMFEHIIKKSKKVDNSDPIMTIVKEDNQYIIRLQNKMINDYIQDIKLSKVSELNNIFDSNSLTLNILSLMKLPKDDQGYRVVIKSKTINQGDVNKTIFLVNFKPISNNNLDFYMSTTI